MGNICPLVWCDLLGRALRPSPPTPATSSGNMTGQLPPGPWCIGLGFHWESLGITGKVEGGHVWLGAKLAPEYTVHVCLPCGQHYRHLQSQRKVHSFTRPRPRWLGGIAASCVAGHSVWTSVWTNHNNYKLYLFDLFGWSNPFWPTWPLVPASSSPLNMKGQKIGRFVGNLCKTMTLRNLLNPQQHE